jgi:hypothetical protein
MTPMRLALALALLLGCTQPRSARCRQICARESECITQTNSTLPFDEKECVAACSALEGDPDNLAKVEKHQACIARQQSCAAVLECQ